VESASACEGAGREIVRALAPAPDDYFVLKPMHSAFFGTPLELLLKHLGATRVLLTGVASDQCIMFSAAEAKMRGLEVLVPFDAVASQSQERNQVALRQFNEVHNLKTPGVGALQLTNPRP
jgi:nicotinamidase-related amidase